MIKNTILFYIMKIFVTLLTILSIMIISVLYLLYIPLALYKAFQYHDNIVVSGAFLINAILFTQAAGDTNTVIGKWINQICNFRTIWKKANKLSKERKK